jgi:hypothetical protein
MTRLDALEAMQSRLEQRIVVAICFHLERSLRS